MPRLIWQSDNAHTNLGIQGVSQNPKFLHYSPFAQILQEPKTNYVTLPSAWVNQNFRESAAIQKSRCFVESRGNEIITFTNGGSMINSSSHK